MKTKQDLINEVHANSDISKEVIKTVVQSFVETLCRNISDGEQVHIRELGTFKVAVRKAHIGRNPATGESMQIPEKRVPQLKFNKAISGQLND